MSLVEAPGVEDLGLGDAHLESSLKSFPLHGTLTPRWGPHSYSQGSVTFHAGVACSLGITSSGNLNPPFPTCMGPSSN